MTTGLVAVVGNPRRGSRTAALAAQLLASIGEAVGGDPSREIVDLAELVETVGPPLGSGSADRYAPALTVVTSARLLVVATPTYKGSYTGLLKAFLDHVAAGRLRGAVAIPVTTVGSPAHTLAADLHLRPLLLELGASTPTSALVVGEDQLADPREAITAWLEVNGSILSAALTTQVAV